MKGSTQINLAKNGQKTAIVGTLRIHSSWDPQIESERFLEPILNDLRHGCTVVIIGAGLGYLDKNLSEKRPDLNIIACHLFPELYKNRVESRSKVHRWHPEMTQSLSNFFYNSIGELDVPGLRIIEWPASVKAIPEISARVSATLGEIVRFHTGNISTTAAFGYLWLRNTIRNYLEINRVAEPPTEKELKVIAASGPSLESHLDILKKNRSRFRLWALPSSLLALQDAGIKPDLIFTSDPGLWARLHGRNFQPEIPIVMPLTASPLPKNAGPVIILAQKSMGEAALLDTRWNTLSIPQAGTVAITAIETWRKTSKSPLVLAGLDLAWQDLQCHCRPHTFDGWLASFDKRTQPAQTTRWQRAQLSAPEKHKTIRTGPTLKTYADWFTSARFDKPVYRLINLKKHCSIPPLSNVEDISPSFFNQFSCLPDQPCKSLKAPIPYTERKERITRLISQWKEITDDSVAYSSLNTELFYCLDPGGVLDIARHGNSVPPEIIQNHIDRVRKALDGLTWEL